jgi:hypothetical protein
VNSEERILMKNKTAIALSALAVTGTLIYGARFAFASTNGSVAPMTEEFRVERRAQMEKGFEAMLERAVENGELTREQKDMLLTKKEQLRSDCENPGEKMRSHREEIVEWAQENGIDSSFLMNMGHGNGEGQNRGNKGMGRRMHQPR